MLLDPKVYVCSRTGADKIGYFAKSGDCIDEFLSDDSEYDIYINGHTVKVERDYMLQDGDMVNAIHRPAGADPVTLAIAVAVITAVLTAVLLPKPEKPNAQGATSSSPNNQISGQTNIARSGDGIPDIKGHIRAYPDLVQSSWYTWEGTRRRVRERFCVGESSLNISDVQDNETSFDDITGSSFEVVERAVQTGDRYPIIADSINDSTLAARNQINIELTFVYLSKLNGVNYVFVNNAVGDDIPVLLGLSNEIEFTVSNIGKPQIDRTFSIDKTEAIISDDLIVFSYLGSVFIQKCYGIPVNVTTDFPTFVEDPTEGGSPPFPDYVKTGYYSSAGQYNNIGNVYIGEDSDGYVGWTKIGKEDQGSFNWYLNLVFSGGLISNNGDSKSVTFNVQARDSVTLAAASFSATIDGVPVAVGSDENITVTGESRSSLGRTIEFVQTQPNTANRIEFRIKRVTDIDPANSASDSALETCYSLVKYSSNHLGPEFTLLDVDAKSDFTNKAQSSRKINCLAKRLQSRANLVSGNWVISQSIENNSFADAVLSDFVKLFGEAKASKLLDFDSLYDAMSHVSDELKQFNYSFDDADISLGQRIHTACNVARVGAYRDGQVWRFYREESKPVTFHFDRRNIAGNAESQMSCRFQKPNDHDSVRLSYIDPSDNKERHVERKINIGAGTFEEGIGSRPFEIDLAGCRNTAQAVNRAELEVRRLVYQRRTVSERVLDDGLLVDIGDRVRWACIYDGDIVDGEVLEINGSQIRISEKLRVSGSLVGHITDINGDVHGPYSVTAGTNGDFWIDGFDTSKAFIANNMPTQLGSRVIIGTTENLDYYDFTVTSKTPNSDGTVQLEMIEYNELMFEED